jgi:hypothetical protein
MSIPPKHVHRHIYHFTHIDNLLGLLKTGLLATNHPKFPKDSHRSVAEPTIQLRRAKTKVTCGPGGVVHDYVPLYLGSLSLMLLSVINKKNVDQMEILYFEFPIILLDREDVIFADASANTAEPPGFYSDPANLDNLNWSEIDSLKWSSSDDTLRHQRMAEALVHGQLSLTEARRVIVWNKAMKERVQEMVTKAGVAFPSIDFESPDRRHYFTKFMHGKPQESLVMGPRAIAHHYQSACEQMKQAEHAEDAPFDTPAKLLEALREDFGCLPETAELVGLKSANSVHKHTVGVHTLEVVEKLKSLSEYTNLPSKGDRTRVELAAYWLPTSTTSARDQSHGGPRMLGFSKSIRTMQLARCL